MTKTSWITVEIKPLPSEIKNKASMDNYARGKMIMPAILILEIQLVLGGYLALDL